jgi:AMP phosphorylase
MAKKASVGATHLVIDLPVGPDVKISSKEKGEIMAKKFIEVGKSLGIRTEVLITDGTEPSGKAFGAALEAKYALEILEGKFFDNLAQKACELAGALFELVGRSEKGKGTALAKEILESGKAHKKMLEIIRAQGARALSSKEIKPARFVKRIPAPDSGEISRINVRTIINIARIAGAPADSKAGVMLFVEGGDKAKKAAPLFEIHAENKKKLYLAEAFAKKNCPIELQKAVLEKIC